ncbi:amidohydrolase family protein [Streptomyces sp. SID4919]|uniref:amidohydrolase family protein n=1 Tax=unclassified Streptomyces TaxID=2593676 RepID=UPI000823E731|nr:MULTISPECIES: amidohydrolase family protein [unclassified Streptomyces]MYY07860.1 amidohydrolase family protein [Streptomyces sp. SID4919]SCK06425.1 Cytosine/adenosine deaminase [Streptomyces sp. AmelKG-E11A]
MVSEQEPHGPPPERPDLLVTGGDVVTMNARREILAGGAVAVAGERVLAVGATSALRERWPGTPELSADGCVVTPGLVNAHQHHTGDPLARARIPDDLPPGASVGSWAIPLHRAHTAADDGLSALLTCVENLRNGVTTVVEAGTVAHPHRVADALRTAGIRGTVGTWGWDVPGAPFAAPAPRVLDRLRALVETYPAGGRVEGWVTLVGHGLASDELLAGAADLARATGAPMTMHMSPSAADPARYLELTGRRPVLHLADLGVLGPHLLLAHAVWLDDAEVDALLTSSTAVAYCPWAYLRLGQGVTRAGRHAELFERGGRLALGTDAQNAGDSCDILKAAALAAGLAKDMRADPTRFGAAEALELATIRGAEAIGMADRIGSLEPGKYADLVVHTTTGPEWTPRGDIAHQLVWSADGRSVRDVLVGGRVVVRDHRCVTVDETELRADAARAAADLLHRSGVPVRSRWPLIAAH